MNVFWMRCSAKCRLIVADVGPVSGRSSYERLGDGQVSALAGGGEIARNYDPVKFPVQPIAEARNSGCNFRDEAGRSDN